ncbi:hypothetical protein LCGC14_1325650 [marine sediment metagenome]|uniref:Uncharacterized protein n=1 Tax=marine sediment metagenome TaxID=412755 RepID=A0A0F9MZ41_9ZZZZ
MANRKSPTADEYKQQVLSWFRIAKQRGSTHMIIAFDTTKQNPFPVYVGSDISVQTKIKSFNDNAFTRAIEVYNMRMDRDKQLGQARTWNV